MLCRSLGFRISHKKTKKTCVKPNGDRVEGEYNLMNISGEGLDEIPTLLPRKQAKEATKGVNFTISQFKIEEIKEQKECTKFFVDGGTAQCFAGDFTIIHSSV
jgi:hypothetical protein